MKKVSAYAPATIGNISCGFDSLGLCLEGPGDTITLTKNDSAGIRITEVHGATDSLPEDPKKNCATAGVLKLLESVGQESLGIDVVIEKGIPSGSGLGSSAASAVASVVACNALLDSPLSTEQLLPYVVYAEKTAANSHHADNVAPALLGGIQFIRSYEPLEVFPLPIPKEVVVISVLPQLSINTHEARGLLPSSLPLEQATQQLRYVGGFISGLYSGNEELFFSSIRDTIAEPARRPLIPGFDAVSAAAQESGARAFGISGAGPSVFALAKSSDDTASIAKNMVEAFSSAGIESSSMISPITPEGAKVLSVEE